VILRTEFYLLYITDLSIVLDSITAMYANNITILIIHNNHIVASLRIQENLSYIQK